MKTYTKVCTVASAALLTLITGCAAMPDALRVMFGPSVEFVQPPENGGLKNYTAVYVTADRNSTVMVEPALNNLTEAKLGLEPLFVTVSTTVPTKASLGENQWAQLQFTNLKAAENRESSVETRVICRDDKIFCKDKDVVSRRQVRCVEQNVTLSTRLVISDLKKKNKPSQVDSTATKSDKHCADDSGQATSINDLKTQALAELIKKSTGNLLPGMKTRPLELIDKDPKASESVNTSLKDAFAQSRAGKLSYSEQVYATLEANGTDSFAVYFNLGLINQMKGRFQIASNYYAKAKGAETPENAELLAKYVAEVNELLGKGHSTAWSR